MPATTLRSAPSPWRTNKLTEQPYDLLVRSPRLFCADSGLDGPGAVAIRGDRIVASGPGVEGPAHTVLDFPDALLLPGLVDLHAHPARGQSRFGIDPDIHFLPRGVTTVMSQGDAGALNIDDYRRTVLEASRTRVLLAINLCKHGETHPVRCFNDLADADAQACADLAVLRWNEEALPLCDVNGEERPGGCWEPVATIRGGQVV